MNKTFFLTMTQVDAVNLSLSKALAIARIVAECGGGEPSPGSASVAMLVAVEELEKVVAVIHGLGRE